MAKIVLIGEAWGQKEHMFEHPFVGPAGVELAKELGQVGFALELPHQYPSELEMIRHWKNVRQQNDIALLNVFNFRPDDNKIDLCFTNRAEGYTDLAPFKAGKFVRPELFYHVEKLWADLQFHQPSLIIPMGNAACWAVLRQLPKVGALRGTVLWSDIYNCKVLPTYHPSAVLHQFNLRTVVLKDYEKAKREAETTEVRRIERFVIINPTLEEIIEWSTRPAEYYAVDIETDPNMRSQISMIGFARTDSDALVIPFIDWEKPGGNYWASPREEAKALFMTGALLKKPIPKLFQNGVFDLSHILRYGFRPEMCQDDTMLLHHARYPEMLKGLGFLGSIYSEEIAWKTMRTKGNNLKRDE